MAKTEPARRPGAGLASGLGLDLDVSITCPLWTETLPDAAGISETAAAAAFGIAKMDGTTKAGAEASIVLADDDFISGLNQDYRGQSGPTNVLSFPASGPDDDLAGAPADAPRLLGDIIVAYETTNGEAAAQGKTLGDHLCHLVVHGMLHLLGHDHQTPETAAAMESLETEILAGLDIAGPYEESVVDGGKD